MTQKEILTYLAYGIGAYLAYNFYMDYTAKAYVKKNITDAPTLAKIPKQFGGTATV